MAIRTAEDILRHLIANIEAMQTEDTGWFGPFNYARVDDATPYADIEWINLATSLKEAKEYFAQQGTELHKEGEYEGSLHEFAREYDEGSLHEIAREQRDDWYFEDSKT